MSAVSRVELAVLCHNGAVHYNVGNTPGPERWVTYADRNPLLDGHRMFTGTPPVCGPHRLAQRTVTTWQPVPEPVPDSGCPK